jgi:hypothetical protein
VKSLRVESDAMALKVLADDSSFTTGLDAWPPT